MTLMITTSTRLCCTAALVCCTASVAYAQSTRDSAGVRIVENTTPAWRSGQEWRLSPKPTLEIEGTDGNELGRIGGATRLSDGRVVVADESTMQLKFFDASGRHLKSVGGKGQGPGEFSNFGKMSRLPGDSIAVDTPRAASVFAPNGTFVRTVQFGPFPAGVLQTPFVAPLGRFDNGTAVVMDFPQGEHGPAGARRWIDSSSLFLVNASGAVVRGLGKAPVAEFVAGEKYAAPLDFGPEAPHAASGRLIYLGFSSQYAIRVYAPDWKLQQIIRRSWTPRPLTSTDLDTYVAGWMNMWSKKTGAEREAEGKKMREDSYAKTLPAYGTILAGGTGEIWVREPDLSGAPGCWCVSGMPTVASRWSVFNASGRWLGDVSMPPRMIPLEIGSDYVLGRALSTDDTPRAVMYKLHKSP